MKIQITEQDFDKAMSFPWGPYTCLIAQTAMRVLGVTEPKEFEGFMYRITDASHKADSAMNLFDRCHGGCRCVDVEKENKLAEIRASLPITVNLK